jgi:hypothetical protein
LHYRKKNSGLKGANFKIFKNPRCGKNNAAFNTDSGRLIKGGRVKKNIFSSRTGFYENNGRYEGACATLSNNGLLDAKLGRIPMTIRFKPRYSPICC